MSRLSRDISSLTGEKFSRYIHMNETEIILMLKSFPTNRGNFIHMNSP